MRTASTLDDRFAKQVRRETEALGNSVSASIARTLDDVLKRRETPDPPPFVLVTVRGAHARSGVDLDPPGALDARDDEPRYGLGSQ